MYCSSCGAQVKPGLNYCKHCGAELAAKDRSEGHTSATISESIVWAIVSVSLGGLALLIGMMAVMKEVLKLSNELIVPFTGLAFLLLIVANCVVIWMGVRTRGDAKRAEKVEPKADTVRELDAAQPRVFPEPVVSITEQTTRELEPASADQKSE